MAGVMDQSVSHPAFVLLLCPLRCQHSGCVRLGARRSSICRAGCMLTAVLTHATCLQMSDGVKVLQEFLAAVKSNVAAETHAREMAMQVQFFASACMLTKPNVKGRLLIIEYVWCFWARQTCLSGNSLCLLPASDFPSCRSFQMYVICQHLVTTHMLQLYARHLCCSVG